jgi:hypothetical protein
MENSQQKMEKGLLRRVRGVQGYGGFFADCIADFSCSNKNLFS